MRSFRRRSPCTRGPTGRSCMRCRPTFAAQPADGRDDLVGMKWVAGFGTNNAWPAGDQRRGGPQRRRHRPASGDPRRRPDHRPAHGGGVRGRDQALRTAGRRPAGRAALIGGGVQGHSHVPLLGHVLPGVELAVFDRHPDRAAALADEARRPRGSPRRRRSLGTGRGRRCRRGRDRRLVRAAPPGDDAGLARTRCARRGGRLRHLLLGCRGRRAALFLVDQREQFLANRDAGLFDDYLDPRATLGRRSFAGCNGRPAASS